MKKKNSIEKPYIKRLNNIDILRELPFYNEFGIVRTSKAFKGYARSCNFEVIDSMIHQFNLQLVNQVLKICLKADQVKLKFLSIK